MVAPLVSAVVPCYNYARYVGRAVESVLHQPGVDVEVVIVNDCSTDASAEVVDALASEHAGVRVVHHERNAGLVATINDGIAVASGDILLVLSADDCLAPGALIRAVTAFENHPDVGLVFGPRREFTDSDVLPAIGEYDRPGDVPEAVEIHVHRGEAWTTERCRQGINLLASPEVFVRMAVQRRIGGYDPACRHTSDLNMWLRAAIASDVAFVAGAPFAYYRRHGLNMSTVEFGSRSADLLERWTGYRRAVEAAGAPAPLAGRWLGAVRRALADEALREARRAQERGASAAELTALTETARELDPARTELAVRGGRVRADYAGRLLHRVRWARWLRRWSRIGI